MKIRLNFQTWDTKFTKHESMKRLWLGKMWTPIIRIDPKQHEIKFK